MIELAVEGFNVRVSGPVPEEMDDHLIRQFRFQPAGVKYSAKFKAGWDGWIHLYRDRRFPVGLMDRFKMSLELFESPYSVVDFRIPGKSIELETSHKFELRPYQIPIVEEGLKRGGGLIQLPTGAGKTVIFIHLMARLGLPAVVLVPTTELVDQTLNMIGAVCPGVQAVHMTNAWLKDPDREWTLPNWAVGTWQGVNTLIDQVTKKGKEETRKESEARREIQRRVKKVFGMFDVIIVDEAHIAGARKVHQVCGWFPSRYRFGTSATPWRNQGDELRMYASIGEVSPGITASELIDLGWLVPPKIKFIRVEPMKLTTYDHQTAVREAIVDNDDRNEQIIQAAVRYYKMKRTCLVMVKQIRHGEILQSRIREALGKEEVAFVHGGLRDKKRRELTAAFRASELPVAISSSVWNVGVDFPLIEAMIMAGPYKSQVANVQRIGRGLRRHCFECLGEDPWPCGHHNIKTDVLVTDFFDQSAFVRGWGLERFDIYSGEPRFVIV